MPDTLQTICCGCCTAIAGCGLAAFIFAAFLAYYVFTTIFGCIIIYYGVALRHTLMAYSIFIESTEDYYLYSSLCISVGTMFTVVVIIGLCAQRTNQSKLMVVSSFIQLAVLVIGIYCYFWAYPGTEKVEKFLSDGFDSALIKYNKTAEAWDDLQIKLECCGKMNYIFWNGTTLPSRFPPISCCHKYTYMKTCSHDTHYDNAGRSAVAINVQGCMPKVQDEMIGQMKTLQGMLIPFLLITLIGFVSSLCNAKANQATTTEGQKVGGLYVNVPLKAITEVVEIVEIDEKEKDGEGEKEGKGEAGLKVEEKTLEQTV